MAYNENSRAKFCAKESKKRLNLKGDDDDPHWIRLVEEILNSIEHASAS